jgi:hypothetical protein
MSSANSNSDLTPESVHEAWLHQGADLERDLFENWTIEVHPSSPIARPRSHVPAAEAARRQPTAVNRELDTHQALEPAPQNQKPAVAPSVAETPAVAEATPPEREDLLQWRRQVEAELAEARRIFEDERQTQQHEFAQQCEAEISRLRRERDDFETKVRQTQLEQTHVRQRRDDDWRQIRDMQLAQVRAERAELEHLRSKWLEMLRREQAVLQYGVQFFGQHLSRVSDELREMQRGLEATSAFATEPTPEAASSEPSRSVEASQPFRPAVLSLDEIRERLNELKQPQRTAA